MRASLPSGHLLFVRGGRGCTLLPAPRTAWYLLVGYDGPLGQLSHRIHLLLAAWRLFFHLEKPSWGRCRKVNVHPLYLLAVAVEPDHTDRRGAVERVLRWVLEITFHHGYVLIRQEVCEVQLHPHLQISLQVHSQGSAPVPNSPLREGQHCIVREGAHEEFVTLPSTVLLPGGVEVTSTGHCELACFVVLQPSGL